MPLVIVPLAQGGIFLPLTGVLAISDLHLGYEQEAMTKGIHLPSSQYPFIERSIATMIKECNPSVVVIAGDLKHDFGGATRQEWQEIERLFAFLKERRLQVVVIKGNHDNFLAKICSFYGVELVDYWIHESVLYTHGDKSLKALKLSKSQMQSFYSIVMGHEHPALSLRDELGIAQKFKCMLRGMYLGKELIVLPALSMYAGGTEMNETPKEALLSPILRDANIGEFIPFVVDAEAGVKEFPPLKKL